MNTKLPKIQLPEKPEADYRSWLKTEACPECDSPDHIEAVEGDEHYIDDQDLYLTQYGPRMLAYKLYSCGYCGAQFRVILGPVGIQVTREPDIDLGD
jgi:hypothetical protein